MKEREENKPTTKGRYRTVTVYVCDQKPDSTEINFHKLPLRNGFRAHDMRQSDNRRTVWEFSFKHAQGVTAVIPVIGCCCCYCCL